MPGLFDNVGNGGGLGGILQGIGSALSPQFYNERLQQQQMQATYQALQQAGAPEHIARAAALNPQQFGSYAAPYLDTAPKIVEGGSDPFTQQKNFVVQRGGPNPSVTAAPVQPAAGQPQIAGGAGTGTTAEGMEAFKAAVQRGEQGEDLYKYLPVNGRNFVRSIVEGRQQVSPMALRNPAMMPFIEAANVIDPTLDMSNPAARQKAMVEAKAGTIANSQRGINQTIHHIVTQLIPAIDATNNTSFTPYNMVKNLGAEMLGKTNTTAFYPTALAVADEMSRAFKGNHMSDAQIHGWAQSLNPNMSPDQQRVAVRTLLGLLQGAADSAHEQRVQGIGPINDAKIGPMIHAQGQKELESIQKWLGPHAAQAAPATPTATAAPGGLSEGMTATNPKTGQKIMFKGGQWVPMQ